jgi:hypothetical protein
MKPVRLEDLHDLLRGAPFAAWWEEHRRAAAALREAEARAGDLAAQVSAIEARADLAQERGIEAFNAAGSLEEESARLAAEAQEVENRSLEAVAAFEAQRERVSDLWVRLGGAESATDGRRERVAAARARAAGTGRAAGDARVDLADEEGDLLHAGRAELSLDEAYRREDAVKRARWGEVEALWARSLELSLLAAERAADARRRRRDAEQLFGDAEQHRSGARALAADRDRARAALAGAGAARSALLGRASEAFGCAAGGRFLYFARGGEATAAFAIALADDAESYGAPVRALGVYAVSRDGGVARLEPAVRNSAT